MTDSRIDALEERLALLEQRLSTAPAHTPAADAAPEQEETRFWALHGLTDRVPPPGAVMIVGDVHLPEGSQALWQEAATTTDLLEDDWQRAADALAALGSPIRLRLLHEVLRGQSTARELAELDGIGTSGQVYHHLRQLTAAGWLRSRSGGRHEVPVERVIPLLATILGARR